MRDGLRIGVDATTWPNRRGYGRFTRNAVGRLVELDHETSYVLYVDQPGAAEAELPPGAEVQRVAVSEAQSLATAADSRRRVRDLIRMARAVRGSHLDALLFPATYSYFPGVGVPTVVGVHDLIADSVPELTFPTRRARGLWRLKERMAVRGARRLFTVSEASRDLLVRRIGLRREDLAVIPEAPDPIFFPRDEDRVAAELRRLGIDPTEGFLLYAGGISPHKGIDTLIDAYSLILRSRSDLPPLLVVGEISEDPFHSAGPAIKRRISALGLEDRILLTGFVPDEALACLYSGAIAVAVPSRAEGFGLPAVEAAACGAPTVLSDIAPHRETLREAALYFEPGDASTLAKRLNALLDDSGLRRSLAADGRRAVAGLTWDTAAQRLGDLVREAATPGRSG